MNNKKKERKEAQQALDYRGVAQGYSNDNKVNKALVDQDVRQLNNNPRNHH